jgi:hypothetical protein
LVTFFAAAKKVTPAPGRGSHASQKRIELQGKFIRPMVFNFAPQPLLVFFSRIRNSLPALGNILPGSRNRIASGEGGGASDQ